MYQRDQIVFEEDQKAPESRSSSICFPVFFNHEHAQYSSTKASRPLEDQPITRIQSSTRVTCQIRQSTVARMGKKKASSKKEMGDSKDDANGKMTGQKSWSKKTAGQRSLQDMGWGTPQSSDRSETPSTTSKLLKTAQDTDEAIGLQREQQEDDVLDVPYVLPPGTVADHPSEYTTHTDFEAKTFKVNQSRCKFSFPDELTRALSAINQLQLTKVEKAQIIRRSPSRNAWGLLRNIEYGRALMFSPNFQAMMSTHQQALLKTWGMEIGHAATCLTIPGDWQSASPHTVLKMMYEDRDGILERFKPKERDGPIGRTFQRCSIRVDGVRLRKGLENRISFDGTKARVFAQCALAAKGQISDIDTKKHASHLCNNPYCQNLEHIVMEDPELNYQRSNCKLRAVKLRTAGEKVPWLCGAHEKGVPDCLLQLAVLTEVERINIQLSLESGRPLETPIEDPNHPYPTQQRSFEDFDGGFDFGERDPSLNELMSRFSGKKPKSAEQGAECPICHKTWQVMSTAIFKHLVNEHSGREEFIGACLEVAKTSKNPMTVSGKISQSLKEVEDPSKELFITIINSLQTTPKKRYSEAREVVDGDEENKLGEEVKHSKGGQKTLKRRTSKAEKAGSEMGFVVDDEQVESSDDDYEESEKSEDGSSDEQGSEEFGDGGSEDEESEESEDESSDEQGSEEFGDGGSEDEESADETRTDV